MNKHHFLEWEKKNINHFFSHFYPPSNGGKRIVEIRPTGNIMVVRNFPLPDHYKPDYLDLLIVTSQYPDLPPPGMHIQRAKSNASLIAQLKSIFGHIYEQGMNERVEEIPDFDWICFHFGGDWRWRFNPRNPESGDSIWKYLDLFYTELERTK